MKELPILFSTPMVNAILEGRKTQTRRVVKFRNKQWRLSYEANEGGRTDLDAFGVLDKHGNLIEIEEGQPGSLKELELCPYGQPGDVLYVRESHAVTYSTGPKMKRTTWYKADNPVIPERVSFKWKPSIHMAKGDARIWLQVSDIKVERLRDISEEDAIAEGVGVIVGSFKYFNPLLPDTYFKEARSAFFSLWESINGKESLDANPWLWVINYKVLSTTGKSDLK